MTFNTKKKVKKHIISPERHPLLGMGFPQGTPNILVLGHPRPLRCHDPICVFLGPSISLSNEFKNLFQAAALSKGGRSLKENGWIPSMALKT